MEFAGNDPGRTAGQLALLEYLRQGDETEVGVAGGNELQGLRNVFTLNEFRLHGVQQLELVQRFNGGRAVGGGFRVGDGQLVEIAVFQNRPLGIDEIGFGRPQHQLADGVSETAAGDGMPFFLQFGRGCVVSGEEDFERRAVDDLGVELACGAEGEDGLVAGVLLEIGGNLLHRRREIGGNRNLHFGGADTRCGEQGDKKGGQALHGVSPGWMEGFRRTCRE
ncbi:hypothetical protein SDC9_118416 [bioreactor metagenome]|uniref:Uncharacterized protein n=1 Tax=bioreactor metagenome TaxID=1076179 RepID=A0A645C3C1_9ZZZZ